MKSEVLRVHRTREQAKRFYDRISRFYDFFAFPEGKYRDRALKLLNIRTRETVLEIGFGTGHSLIEMAKMVGDEGKVYGIDISPGMLRVTKRRLQKAGLLSRVELYCGDAMSLPYENEKFDAVFMSFTLELFDTPEIPRVLAEVGRVLKPNGRLGVVSISKGEGLVVRIYERLHEKFPQCFDCRPICAAEILNDAGFKILHRERVSLFGLPSEIVIAMRYGNTDHCCASGF